MKPFSFLRRHREPYRSTISVKITHSVQNEVVPPFPLFKRSLSRQEQSRVSLSIKQELPDVFTPRLPPELWLQIFLCAARDQSDVTIAGSHYTHPHSFLQVVPAHAHLPERLTRYRSWLKWKASLSTVCSLFNAIAQEVLYEDVWITGSKDGRRLAERLGGSADTSMVRITSVAENKSPSQAPKPRWRLGRKTKTKHHPLTTSPPVHRSSRDSTRPGRFIRRLRVETSAMDQCSPHDLLLILQHCPGLLVFEDCRSIRRPMHPLIITGSDVAPFDFNPDVIENQAPDSTATPLLTTDVLAQTILSRPLKRLTWTNYAHDGGNFDRGVRVYANLLAPLLDKAGSHLEVLEITTSAGGMTMGSSDMDDGCWVVARPEIGSRRTSSRDPTPSVSRLKLEPESVTTRQFLSTNLPGLSSHMTSIRLSSNHYGASITLPALQSLKATLDNATFSVLATWSMPSLRSLSVVSPDFKFGLEGLRRFLEAHGARIEQLELGHSHGELEEFWITEQSREFRQRSRIRLDVWCPSLKEFICNADAEWNWESPDWIAPHALLPAHPGLEFIGVRGLEKRFVNDAAEFMRTGSAEEYPYFMLLQQFSSMLRAEAFPSLKCVRDLSWQSDAIRRTGKLRPGSTAAADPGPPPPSSVVASPSFPFLQSNRFLSSGASRSGSRVKTLISLHVLRFWDEALQKCWERGVSVENYLGVVVTGHHSKRASVIEE